MEDIPTDNNIPPEVEANIEAILEFTKSIEIIPYNELSDTLIGTKEEKHV